MATYNIDQFRRFVLGSSFLKRYKVEKEVLKRMQTDEVALMVFGFEWVLSFVWGIRSNRLKTR